MSLIIQFLIQYKELILALITIIFNCVIMIVSNKKQCTIDFLTAMSRVVARIPEYIKTAEASYPVGHGDDKLLMVLNIACQELAFLTKSTYEDVVDSCSDTLRKYIEDVLDTPTKK
ncbi:hypothetical protein [Capybara microvirus Cap3_SP_445]|nr:hypothetical protein [Capybara microvirus Cap3_SP_445]